jgi:lipopolysaccharide/colanic/teichoic acid biosynthesis glycosyltransferase
MSNPLSAETDDGYWVQGAITYLPRRTRFKRVVDLVLATIGLVVLAPIMGALVVIIRLDSRGPAFYGQQRVGRFGAPFNLWKLRSMYSGSNQEFHHQASRDWFSQQPNAGRYKTDADPRVTRFGRYLRRASLDELPQLFNVVKGEMSLVGPRPMMPYDRPRYENWHFEREAVRPGITGLWQVSGRDRLSAHEMMVLDARYVREWTFWLDLKILSLTGPAILRDLLPARRGPYRTLEVSSKAVSQPAGTDEHWPR